MTNATDPVFPQTAADARVTPWGPNGAVTATVVVIVASFAASVMPLFVLPVSLEGISVSMMLASIAVSQLVMGVGGWWLAGTRGGDRSKVLSLAPMRVSLGSAALAIVAMFAATSAFQAIRHYGLGHDIFEDMRAMAPLFQGAIWPLSFFVVACIAPIAEEVLFRGFLMSAFGNSRTGFWLGVAISTLIWTALHIQYKLPALMLVALMGVIFSMMLRWSGSLRLPLLAHAINNAVACLYLMFFLKP